MKTYAAQIKEQLLSIIRKMATNPVKDLPGTESWILKHCSFFFAEWAEEVCRPKCWNTLAMQPIRQPPPPSYIIQCKAATVCPGLYTKLYS